MSLPDLCRTEREKSGDGIKLLRGNLGNKNVLLLRNNMFSFDQMLNLLSSLKMCQIQYRMLKRAPLS